jgi:hypothetical protein
MIRNFFGSEVKRYRGVICALLLLICLQLAAFATCDDEMCSGYSDCLVSSDPWVWCCCSTGCNVDPDCCQYKCTRYYFQCPEDDYECVWKNFWQYEVESRCIPFNPPGQELPNQGECLAN